MYVYMHLLKLEEKYCFHWKWSPVTRNLTANIHGGNIAKMKVKQSFSIPYLLPVGHNYPLTRIIIFAKLMYTCKNVYCIITMHLLKKREKEIVMVILGQCISKFSF